MKGTRGRGSTGTTITKSNDYLDLQNDLDTDFLLDIALEMPGVYYSDYGCYVVPMYDEYTLISDIKPENIVGYIRCPECNKVKWILDDGVDAIAQDMYTINNKGTTILGVCATCATAVDITDYIGPYCT